MKKHTLFILFILLGVIFTIVRFSWVDTLDWASPGESEDTPFVADARDSSPSIEVERDPIQTPSALLGAAVDAEQIFVFVDAATGETITSGVIVSEDRELFTFDLSKGEQLPTSAVPKVFAAWSEGYIPKLDNLPQSGKYTLKKDPGIIVSTNLDLVEWNFSKSILPDNKSKYSLEIELFNILTPYLTSVADSNEVWLPGWPFWCSSEIMAYENEWQTVIPVIVPPCRERMVYARRISISPNFAGKTITLETPSGTPRVNVVAEVLGVGEYKSRTQAISDKDGKIHFPYDLDASGGEVVRVKAKYPTTWTHFSRVRFKGGPREGRLEIGEADFVVNFGSNDVADYEFAIAAAWNPGNFRALFGSQPSFGDLIWISPSLSDLADGGMQLMSGWHGKASCLLVRSKASETVLAAFEINDGEEFYFPEIQTGKLVIECERQEDKAWGYFVQMIVQHQSMMVSSGSALISAKGTSQESTVELILPPGEYALTTFGPKFDRFRIANGETTTIHTRAPAMKEVNIAVETVNGKPIPDAALFFYKNSGDVSYNYGLKVTCNEQGEYKGFIPEELVFCRAGSAFAVIGGYDSDPILSDLVAIKPEVKLVVPLDVGWVTLTGLPVTQTYLGRNNSSSIYVRGKGQKGGFRVPLSETSDFTFELPGGEYEIFVGSGTSEYAVLPYVIDVIGGNEVSLNFYDMFGREVFFLELLAGKSELDGETYLLKIWVDEQLVHEAQTHKRWLQESQILVLPVGKVKISWGEINSVQTLTEFYSGGHGSYKAVSLVE